MLCVCMDAYAYMYVCEYIWMDEYNMFVCVRVVTVYVNVWNIKIDHFVVCLKWMHDIHVFDAIHYEHMLNFPTTEL